MPSARPIDKPFVSDDRVITFDPWTVVAFIFPLTKLFTISLGGTLFGQDILGVAMFLFFIVQKDGITRLNQIWPVLALLVTWLTSQIVTDLYRGTPFEDYSRGWLKIIMFGFQIMALWLFLPRRSHYIAAFAIGQALSLIGSYPAIRAEYGDQFWKFGIGDGVSLLVAAIFAGMLPGTAWLRRYAWIALAATAVMLLLVNYRSGFGVLLVASGICFLFTVFDHTPALRKKFNGITFSILLLAGVAFSQAVFSVYGYVASSGALGAEAEYKYELQSRGDVPVLLGGRVESLISTEAIADSPILGHGSWAKNIYYSRLLRVKMRELGIPVIGSGKINSDLIPTHSYLFGAWVDAGILGGLFWIYILSMLIGTIYLLFKHNFHYRTFFITAFIMVGWAILFSPFGAETRFNAGFTIVLALCLRRAVRQQTASGFGTHKLG